MSSWDVRMTSSRSLPIPSVFCCASLNHRMTSFGKHDCHNLDLTCHLPPLFSASDLAANCTLQMDRTTTHERLHPCVEMTCNVKSHFASQTSSRESGAFQLHAACSLINNDSFQIVP